MFVPCFDVTDVEGSRALFSRIEIQTTGDSCLVTALFEQGPLSLLADFTALQPLTLSQLQLSSNFSRQQAVCWSCC